VLIDGKYYVFMEYVSKFCNIAKFCFATEESATVLQHTDWIEDWLISDDGKTVFCTTFSDHDSAWDLFCLKNPDENTVIVGPVMRIKTRDDDPGLVGWAQDGVSVIVSQSSGEGRDYFEVSPKGQRGKVLDAEAVKFGRSPFFNPKTRRIAGFTRHDDWFRYDCFDPLMAKLVEAVPQKLPVGCRWSFVDFADDPRKMIVYTESATDSGSYYFIDFSTGDVKFMAENYPDLPVEWLTEKKPIDYLAADGLKIHAYLTLPPKREAKNLPLIVLPHGGPEARDYIDFDWQAQALASRGYAVLQPNFRGSSDYGAAFTNAGHGQWGRKMQTDLSDGVRELVKQGVVDPKRVAIVGASYGGYAALAGATLDAGVYRCAVSIAGVADLEYFTRFEKRKYGHMSSAAAYWKDYLGDGSYADISPLRQAAHAYCPILLIHGKDDTVVPFYQSEEMEKALKAAGKTVEFVPFEGQDHWELNEASRISMMKDIVAFLDKYNPA
jgi:acetyl esterase/lipase